MTISYEWRGDFDNAAIDSLHAEGFDHRAVEVDWHTGALHVDFEHDLRTFYFDRCGFKPTGAGLIAL